MDSVIQWVQVPEDMGTWLNLKVSLIGTWTWCHTIRLMKKRKGSSCLLWPANRSSALRLSEYSRSKITEKRPYSKWIDGSSLDRKKRKRERNERSKRRSTKTACFGRETSWCREHCGSSQRGLRPKGKRSLRSSNAILWPGRFKSPANTSCSV